MPKFYMPSIGTEIVLTEPWEFLLYAESRNETLFKAFGKHILDLAWEEVDPYPGFCSVLVHYNVDITKQTTSRWGQTYRQICKAARLALPVGTKLRIDRVYVRAGQNGEFDSVTMSILDTTHPFLLFSGKTKSGGKKKCLGRFWTKLCDFNTISADVTKDTVKTHI